MSDAAKVIQTGYDAQSLKEKLEPFLAVMEQDAIESALLSPYAQPEGARETHQHLDDVKAIRRLRDALTTAIMLGSVEQQKKAR